MSAWKTIARRYANGGMPLNILPDEDVPLPTPRPKMGVPLPVPDPRGRTFSERLPRTADPGPLERPIDPSFILKKRGLTAPDTEVVPPDFLMKQIFDQPLLPPQQEAARGGRVSPDQMKKVAGPLGHNTGGVFQDGRGKHYYVKRSKSEDVAKNEKLAAELYKAVGVPVVDHYITEWKGKTAVVSKMLKGKRLKQIKRASYPYIKHLQEGFPADVWLGNYDVVGLDKDNIIVGNDGVAYRVDVGASLTRRAKGGKKSWWGPKVIEFGAMLNPRVNKYANSVFNTKKFDPSVGEDIERKRKAVAKKIANLSDERIKSIVNKFGPGVDSDKTRLASDLIARRDQVAEHYGVKKKYQEGGAVTDTEVEKEAENERLLRKRYEKFREIDPDMYLASRGYSQYGDWPIEGSDPASNYFYDWQDYAFGVTDPSQKLQEGGAVEDDDMEDVPGVGAVPTKIEPTAEAARQLTDPLIAGAKAASGYIGGLERAVGMDPQSREAVGRMVMGQAYDPMKRVLTSPEAEAALGVVGGLPPGGRPPARPPAGAISMEPEAIANRLVEAHGNDFEQISNRLDDIKRLGGRDRAKEVFEALPPEHRQGILKRDMELAMEQDQSAGMRPVAEGAHPNEPISGGGHLSLSELHNSTLGPEDVSRLSDSQLGSLETELEEHQRTGSSLYDNFINYRTDLYDALQGRLAERRENMRAQEGPSAQRTTGDFIDMLAAEFGAMPTRQQRAAIPPEVTPFSRVYPGFTESFQQHLQRPLGMDMNQFADKMFGGLDTSNIGATHMGHGYFNFSGRLFTPGPDRQLVGQINRDINIPSRQAYHALFELEDDFKGAGIAPKILKNQVDIYQKLGINNVKLTTGLDSGAYTWLKYGFLPQKGDWDYIRELSLAEMGNGTIQSDPTTMTALHRIFNDPDPRAAWQLGDLKTKNQYGANIGSSIMLGSQDKTIKAKMDSGELAWDAKIPAKKNWTGHLFIDNTGVMNRFNRYATRKPKKEIP